jgi:hypothetical protein
MVSSSKHKLVVVEGGSWCWGLVGVVVVYVIVSQGQGDPETIYNHEITHQAPPPPPATHDDHDLEPCRMNQNVKGRATPKTSKMIFERVALPFKHHGQLGRGQARVLRGWLEMAVGFGGCVRCRECHRIARTRRPRWHPRPRAHPPSPTPTSPATHENHELDPGRIDHIVSKAERPR